MCFFNDIRLLKMGSYYSIIRIEFGGVTMTWNIGNVTIKNKVVLAPMAGISNSAYRRICKEMGVGLVFAEMVSDKAIVFNNKKTIDMLYMTQKVVQLYGKESRIGIYIFFQTRKK